MPTWFLGRHLGHGHRTAMQWDVLESGLSQPGQQRTGAAAGVRAPRLPQPQPAGHRHQTIPASSISRARWPARVTYDLASLLRDCYIAWDRERVEHWVESYRQGLRLSGLLDASVDAGTASGDWFDRIGLQRHIKVLGIFCRLHYRDDKDGYLRYLPRVLDYVLEVAGRHPELAPLAKLIRRAVGDRDLTVPRVDADADVTA